MDSKTKRDDREEEDDPSSFLLLVLLVLLLLSVYYYYDYCVCDVFQVSGLPSKEQQNLTFSPQRFSFFFRLLKVSSPPFSF